MAILAFFAKLLLLLGISILAGLIVTWVVVPKPRKHRGFLLTPDRHNRFMCIALNTRFAVFGQIERNPSQPKQVVRKHIYSYRHRHPFENCRTFAPFIFIPTPLDGDSDVRFRQYSL